jgi:nucleoside-diphosphate-sugar epimerase
VKQPLTNPSNPYAIAKDTLCKMLQTISLSNTINLKWLRLFYMYGKGQAPTSLFSQLETAIARNDNTFNMSGGEQTRDFLPVEKVVEIIVQLTFLNTNAGVVNCCSGKPQKVKDFVTQIINERSSSIKLNLGYYPYTSYEPMCFWGDTTKLNTLLLSR